MKKCNKCEEIKEFTEFSSRTLKSGKLSFQPKCKSCMKDYYLKNKVKWKYIPSDKNREKAKKYAANHQEQRRVYLKKYQEENKDKIASKKQEYRKQNAGKFRAMNANRRAKKIKATIGNYKECLEIIYQTTTDISEYFEIDHIIPLIHKDVCGLHVPWNLQVLPTDQNLKKGNKFDGTNENNSWNN